MFKKMRFVILFEMLLNASFKMTTSFADVARTTASTSQNYSQLCRYDVLLLIFYFKHSHKKQKGSLECSLDRVLFSTELEFPKIVVPRLPQITSNVNNEFDGKSKQLYPLYDQLLEH